jgi:hypothetical protein
MTTTTEVTITCDDCKKAITSEELYVAAGSYGADFHLSCFQNMSTARAMVLLGIDDIKVMKYDDWEGAIKINSYYRHLR